MQELGNKETEVRITNTKPPGQDMISLHWEHNGLNTQGSQTSKTPGNNQGRGGNRKQTRTAIQKKKKMPSTKTTIILKTLSIYLPPCLRVSINLAYYMMNKAAWWSVGSTAA